MIRKMALGFVIFLVICVAVYLRVRQPKPSLGMAYAGDRDMTLWNSSAQVRAPIATVNYGDPLQILARFGDQVEVRTPTGVIGWTIQENLLSAELWQREKDLGSQTAAATAEARGHTHVLSNLHFEPARNSPRVRQLKKDVLVELFTRQVVAVPGANQAPAPSPAASAATTDSTTSDDAAAPAAANEPKKEDWWLVRAQLDDKSTLSGWLLGRFVDLDVPQPLPDYASSAGMRIVAWFELNHVPDVAGPPKAQYLLVGTNGAEGQACDFTLLRVYTWGKQRERYETAYVQSDVCGKLPVTVARAGGAGDISFSFFDLGDGALRTYRMHQTIVRRADEGTARKGAQ